MIQKKDILRNLFKLNRDAVDNKTELSEKICQTLFKSDEYRNCESIFLYASCGSEVCTDSIMHRAFADGKRVAFPRCIDKNGNMKFYYINSSSELILGYYGIKAPPTHTEAYFGNENTLCIVPGLAFSIDGYRLGYGKGYYDRFLSEFKGVSIGLCYDVCLCKTLPTDEYDKKVNYLITDKRVYNFT